MDNNELYHHGIPGMKWGARHDRVSLGQRRISSAQRKALKSKAKLKKLRNKQRMKNKLAKTKAENLQNKEKIKQIKAELRNKPQKEPKVPKPEKVDNSAKKKINKRSLKDIPDDELNSIVNRMRLEESYRKEIDTLNQRKSSVIKSIGGELAKTAKTIIGDNATDIGKQYVKQMMADFANEKYGAEIVFTNSKKK